MLLTIVLVASVIGMLLLVPNQYSYSDNVPSTWMKLGKSLMDSAIK